MHDHLTLLEARGLSRSFPASGGTRHILRDVSLRVRRGSFVSIVGTMGSGKSTLLSLLAGLTRPEAGSVIVAGEPLTGIRHDAAFVFQNYSLLPWMTALENVRVAVGAAFPDLSRTAQKAAATEMLERVGLGNALSRRPRQLSGGMRQRVALARAFATKPRLLFLDDPFGALDALTRETLQQELGRLCADPDRPVTTVMITNSVEEAILLSDEIVPMIPGPPARVGSPITVDLSRPRTVAQLAHDEAAMNVRARVISTLTANIKTRSGVPTASQEAPRARGAEARLEPFSVGRRT